MNPGLPMHYRDSQYLDHRAQSHLEKGKGWDEAAKVDMPGMEAFVAIVRISLSLFLPIFPPPAFLCPSPFLSCPFHTQPYYVAQASLEFISLLSLSTHCWDYKYVPLNGGFPL